MQVNLAQLAARKAISRARSQAGQGTDSYSPIGLTDFKRTLWRRYTHTPFLALVDDALEAVERYVRTEGAEGIRNLRIEIPVRHGKSWTAARLFPAWFLGRNPDKRVILASYGESLAVKHSRVVRNILKMPDYQRLFPGVTLALDSQAKDAWDLAPPHEGGMDAVGKGGAVTGKGAHLIVTDDLVKSRAEAESALQRDKDWDWLQDDLLTRKEPGAAHVTIGARWHIDDVHGRLERLEGELWHTIRLPALAEENDLLGRAVGEALWPERYPAMELALARRRMGDYSFSALYQQRPVPAEGGIFKRDKFNVIDSEPADIERRARFWDLAFSERTSADYNVGLLLGQTRGKRLVVLDVVRVQVDWDDVLKLVAKTATADGKSVAVGVEAAFYQSSAARKLLALPELHSFNVRGYKPDGDKLTRALPFAARVGEGMVDVLRRSWTEPFIEELCSFPMGAHDDMVDGAAGAYLMLDRNEPIKVELIRYA